MASSDRNEKILDLVSKIRTRDEEKRKVESAPTKKPEKQGKESKRKASGVSDHISLYLSW